MNKDLAQYIIERSLKHGADAVRVVHREDVYSGFSLLNHEIDNIQESSSSSVSISIFKDSKFGHFSSNILDKKVLDDFLKKAIVSTQILSPDVFRALPDPALYFKGEGKDLGQEDANFEKISVEDKKAFLHSLSKPIDKRIQAITNNYDDSIECTLTMDSQGFIGESKQSYFNVFSECTVKGDGDSRPQGWWQDGKIHFNELGTDSADIALKRALSMLNPKKISSGLYPIVLENHISLKLLSPIISALYGASIQQRTSFLLDSIGKEMFNPRLTIVDRPHTYGSLASRLFDSEGIATRDMDIIKNGILNTYFINTYYSKKLDMDLTIEGPSFLSLEPFGERDQQAMINSLDKGILISGFNGGNCNGATGDFSYGIEGFYFEKGCILHPVRELNITGNMLELWRNISHIGSDLSQNTSLRMPSLCFEAVNISGI